MSDTNNESRKIVKGEVKKMERLGVFDLLFAGDIRSAYRLAVREVLRPRLMDIIVNFVDTVTRSFVYGDDAPAHDPAKTGNTPYRTISTSGGVTVQAKAPDRYDVGTVEFAYYEDAKAVIDGLRNQVHQFKYATLGDFYDFAGQGTVTNDFNYGWKSIGDIRPERTKNGWVIRLPRPIPIER